MASKAIMVLFGTTLIVVTLQSMMPIVRGRLKSETQQTGTRIMMFNIPNTEHYETHESLDDVFLDEPALNPFYASADEFSRNTVADLTDMHSVADSISTRTECDKIIVTVIILYTRSLRWMRSWVRWDVMVNAWLIHWITPRLKPWMIPLVEIQWSSHISGEFVAVLWIKLMCFMGFHMQTLLCGTNAGLLLHPCHLGRTLMMPHFPVLLACRCVLVSSLGCVLLRYETLTFSNHPQIKTVHLDNHSVYYIHICNVLKAWAPIKKNNVTFLRLEVFQNY